MERLVTGGKERNGRIKTVRAVHLVPKFSHGDLDYSPPILYNNGKERLVGIVQISKVGRTMLAFQEKLAVEYGYAPIEPNLFLGDVREKYRTALPEWCKLPGDSGASLFSLDGTQICNGYKRIVIGDYGAFVEISPKQILKNNICCKIGQEYRFTDERYAKNVKYLWLTAADSSDCKIYLQKKRVEYADYMPGMYYVSPYEVVPGSETEV